MPEVRWQRRWGGHWMLPIRATVTLLVWLPIAVGVAAAVALGMAALDVPRAPSLEAFATPRPATVTTRDGWRIGGAPPVADRRLEAMPPMLVAAVLAAEDARFFEHRAFSLRAVARAAVANLREGHHAQGGSTLTQQLAKRFLSSEKTYRRKLDELLIARRLEALYTKRELLEAYLNSVYLGQRSHGVVEASWTYFGRPPEALEVGQMAVLAGILPAPSAYNPIADPEQARKQRDRVLRRMADLGILDAERLREERERPLGLAPAGGVELDRMPWAARAARRSLAETAGAEAWAKGGHRLVVAHDPLAQADVRRSLRQAVAALDRRQGWRGALGRAGDAAAVDEALADQAAGRFALARVAAVEPAVATVAVGPKTTLAVALEDASWAEPAETERHYKRPVALDDLRRILAVDDLVVVERDARGARLAQPPAFEGAMALIDPRTGGLQAAVGGYDADATAFDRVAQACRQPGSVFKPVVYAEGLSRGLTPATMLADVPGEYATGRGEVWTPRNADRDFGGYMTMADALARSRNIPTVHLMDHLGPRAVVSRAKKLGLDSPLDTTSSVALGASCAAPLEIAEVFAAFQRRGHSLEVVSVETVEDARGVVEDRGHFAGPGWATAARLSRLAVAEPLPERGISPQVAFQLNWMLRRVVTRGTAHALPDAWPVAGKTGTTNDFDGWFVGYDGQLTAVTWVGSDKNTRPLGAGEHGATVAMPAFEALYPDYLSARPPLDEREPPAGVVFVPVDARTGLRSRPGEAGEPYPFLEGTAPAAFAPGQDTRQAQQIDALSHEF